MDNALLLRAVSHRMPEGGKRYKVIFNGRIYRQRLQGYNVDYD